jgi:hypothetical protein
MLEDRCVEIGNGAGKIHATTLTRQSSIWLRRIFTTEC